MDQQGRSNICAASPRLDLEAWRLRACVEMEHDENQCIKVGLAFRVPSSVAHKLVDSIRFVMDAKAVNDGRACLVESQHLYFRPFTPEFENDLIE